MPGAIPAGTLVAMRCRRCGHENAPGANYCSSCGAALVGIDDTTVALAAIEDRQELEAELGNLLTELPAGMGMLVSAAMSSGRAAGGTAVLVVVLWYFFQTFGTAGERISFLKYLGPYYYAPSSRVILSGEWVDPWKLLVPMALGLLCGIAGLVWFQRRDII